MDETVTPILQKTEDKMKKTVELFKKELATLRAGRASASLLERVTVDYYGTTVPVTQLATITTPEPRLLVIQPWDKNAFSAIEKAILKSDLGITPTSDGSVIRLVIPELTQERRAELTKFVRKRAEEDKVAIRNLRRDANDEIKALEKAGKISEDELKKALDDVQKLTDKYIKEIETLQQNKEREIMTV